MSTEAHPPVATNVGPADAREKASRFQFGLRDMFLLTTGVAVALGIALWRGIGTLPHTTGMLLAMFNAMGKLAVVQHRKARSRWITAAWLLLVLSLFLPVAKGCGNQYIYGWEAGWVAASAEANVIGQQMGLVETGDVEVESFPWGLIFLTLINLGNIAMLLLPLAWLMFRNDRGRWYGNFLALCAVSAWLTTWHDETKLLIGFYAWCLSYALFLVSFRLHWKTFVLLVVWSAIMIVAGLMDKG